jgi:hypothetical protein
MTKEEKLRFADTLVAVAQDLTVLARLLREDRDEEWTEVGAGPCYAAIIAQGAIWEDMVAQGEVQK